MPKSWECCGEPIERRRKKSGEVMKSRGQCTHCGQLWRLLTTGGQHYRIRHGTSKRGFKCDPDEVFAYYTDIFSEHDNRNQAIAKTMEHFNISPASVYKYLAIVADRESGE